MYQQSRFPGLSNLPPVVKNLLIINGLCFGVRYLLLAMGKHDINAIFGLYYPETPEFKPYQLITHVFMHGSGSHLFFNMLSLILFGPALEHRWGAKRFFTFYFFTAFGAAALHMGVDAAMITKFKMDVHAYLANPGYDAFFNLIQKDHYMANSTEVADFLLAWSEDKSNPGYFNDARLIAGMMIEAKMRISIVGASGAVYGLLLAFGMLSPNSELSLLFFPLPIKAKYFVLIMGALQLFYAIKNDPKDNVGHVAHLGGMLFGYILIKIWNKDRRTFY